ncbi:MULTISPECIES: hypothetical protein [Staphylococcus]|uniref:hypothetical protein n=1 Tax=Staphylococcus TaxID=1279 RepID=UPI00069E2DAE|nr:MULTISPECIES: hypothetical protein [Staphylococcus]WRV64821.1 hypothetical protein VQ623_00700 [Staphylococcus haemolyticus]
MKKFLSLSITFMLVLTACSTHEPSKENKTESHTKQTDTKTTKDNKKQNKDDNKKKDEEKNKDIIPNFSEKEKLALAFCVDHVDQYTLTKNEILTGFYLAIAPAGEEHYKLVDFTLVKYDKPIANAPKDMHFYTVYPDKRSFAAIIGVNNEKIFLGGTQAAIIDYNELMQHGREVNLKDVYLKNKNNKALPELVSKMHIDNKYPEISYDENGMSNKELERSGVVGLHLRNQIYQIIADFEGISLKDSGYLWEDVKLLNSNGDWSVRYRNQDGEIVGSYRNMNDKIQKLDANGNVVKEKKVE